MCTYVTAFMGSVVFCVGGCLPVLLDASFATANAEAVVSHLISLDVAGMIYHFIHSFEGPTTFFAPLHLLCLAAV